ncbi:MAG: hypothetical protein HEQ13_17085 [Dolichospermum sp. DEX189]|uniref:Uncharacterized protein n=1 Tax=Aphanizomenon flos-aquae FACHB-1040 TaxID=2692887 RepID=A0ABR8C374_APHFL|nr:hypothetical protein [Aphanizomenon flos-aquae]MBD2281563.1 hypothetical protein [Aphanizomenon flos-aquae FACHB-1040]MBO1070963.1 hypothetical protein [Dolichospermum sp. DEX189]MBO1070964.1 hypothetical protein [Dolichospermum sp. DEX189]
MTSINLASDRRNKADTNYIAHLRMNSESNSKSRLKTTQAKFIVRFNGL